MTNCFSDTPASEFLFTPTLPSSFTPASSLPLATSDPFLQKYTINLRRQLNGRTPTLNNLLNLLEQCADDMNNDVSELSSSSSDDYTYVRGYAFNPLYLTISDQCIGHRISGVVSAIRRCLLYHRTGRIRRYN